MTEITTDFVDLPAPSDTLLSVIRYCSDEEISAEYLAGLIKLEPVLTAELLKIVNSAYYGFATEVTSIDRMIVMMGIKPIRSLALCIAMRNISQNNTIKGFDDKLYWQDSIRRAVISSVLAQQLNYDKDECFTAGLLQDIGLLLLFSQNDEHEEFVKKYRQYNPDLRSVLEQDEFFNTHNQVASFLQSQWALPEVLVSAISSHHNNSEGRSLENLLYCADWLNALLTLSEKEGLYQHCIQKLKQCLDLDAGVVNKIIKELPHEINAVSEALGCKVDEEYEIEELMQVGAQKMAEYNLELQELTLRLKKTMDERDKLSAELNKDVQIARDVQSALLPKEDNKLPVFAFNVPAKELSGDFYDYFELDRNQVFFCLGDVSGKGVYASLLMVKTSSLFRSHCHADTDLTKAAAVMNDELCRVTVRGMFVTMVFGYFDRLTRQLHYINAGHLPILLTNRMGECKEIEASSPPLGIINGQEFVQNDVSLIDSCFYAYTDGITESYFKTTSGTNEKKMLGVEGLIKLLRNLNDKPASVRLKKLLAHFKKTQQFLHDDTTMLLLDGS